ncbi:hypothetical protein H1C71_017943, partial [Ictidomys tridecemlineatus]
EVLTHPAPIFQVPVCQGSLPVVLRCPSLSFPCHSFMDDQLPNTKTTPGSGVHLEASRDSALSETPLPHSYDCDSERTQGEISKLQEASPEKYFRVLGHDNMLILEENLEIRTSSL